MKKSKKKNYNLFYCFDVFKKIKLLRNLLTLKFQTFENEEEIFFKKAPII